MRLPASTLRAFSWRRLALTLAVAGAVIISTGCQPGRRVETPPAKPRLAVSPQAVLTEMGLQPSALGRSVLVDAMMIANRLAQDQVVLRVVPAWAEMKVEYETDEPPLLIPVIVAAANNLPPKSLAFVPSGKSCIIVNGERVHDLLDDLPPESVSGSTREVLLPTLWAMILLHELGHVFFSDHSRGPMLAVSGGELNLARDANKLAEFRCDHFAAMQVRMCLVPGSRGDWATGLAPQVEHDAAARYLGNPLQDEDHSRKLIDANMASLAVGLVAHDYWNEISDRETPAPQMLFWDRGYSHPNLRLRFLYMASVIEPGSKPYQTFLQQMLAIRDQRAYDVLYRAEYTGLPRPTETKTAAGKH